MGVSGKGAKNAANGQTGYIGESSISHQYVHTGDMEKQASIIAAPMSPEMKRLAKGFSLCVAYGASIGGIASLTGTPPNLVLKQQADKCCKAKPEIRSAVNETIRQQYNALGRLRFVEIEVLIVFLVILWLFRSSPNIDGWGDLFDETGSNVKYSLDSTPCILLSIVLFILPARIEDFIGWPSEGEVKSLYSPILSWKVVARKLPWDVIVLLGGGFTIAKASEISGLSKWLGEQMASFADLHDWVMNLRICLIVAGFTEIASNATTATLLMPIMGQLAIATQIRPLYLMMPSAIAGSFAFMLPVSSPPNTVVFATGYLTFLDMVLVGLPVTVIAIGCLTLAINTWGEAMYELDSNPDFFLNSTSH